MGEGAAAMTQHERDVSDERSPEQIEFEIQRTRERMSSNIDELGDRLSPDNLKQQAKEALSEKAQDVVAGVGDQARETGTRMMEFITRNPLPVAAVGLGAIWLFTLRKGNRSEVSGDRMARFAYTGPERREPNGRPSLGRRLADRADSVRHTVSDSMSDVSEKAGELKERVQQRAGHLGEVARERARGARGGLERMSDDNPLALVAGAAVIGLALGMLLPETEPERRVMGAKRDEIVDRVQEVAGRVKDAAVEAGRELQDTVREEVSQRGPEVKETLKEAAEDLKDQLKSSAGRVAQEVKRPAGGDAGATG
jgi:ElaB/YqjD/DUF883 family membrane-anchored ribosome-binding protein